MADFSTLLSKPVTSAERPKPKAPGMYNAVVVRYELSESAKKRTPFVRFHLGSVSPGPEVDMQQNAANGVDLNKWQPHADFYLTEDAMFRLREFLESCKINVEGRSFNETLPETAGKPVMFECVHETSSRPGEEASVYSNVVGLVGA